MEFVELGALTEQDGPTDWLHSHFLPRVTILGETALAN
jgi:hypothetical protein